MGTQSIMPPRPIKRLVIEYADGEISEVLLPEEGQGFQRERYTYEAKEGAEGTSKFVGGRKLTIYEIYWVVSS